MDNNQNLILAEAKISNNCANYVGTVTVSTYQNDRLISTQTSHNTGMANLFSFIANCLTGSWTNAKSSRPCKLVLLKKASGENLNESTPLTNPDYWRGRQIVANPIMYDTAALNVTTNSSSSITYHFRIPFLSLLSGAQVHKLLLLPSISTDIASNACAYYILKDGIQIPEIGGNYTIIVDWTLTFQNGGN